MTSTIFSALVALMSLVAAPGAAPEQPGARQHRGRAHGLCQKLECTEDQRAQIKEIRAEHKQGTADEREQMKRLRAEMKAERSAPEPNTQRVEELRSEMDALKAKVRESRVEAKAAITAALDDEQRQEFAELQAERKAKRRKHEAKRGKQERRAEGKGSGKRGPEGKGKKGERGGPRAESKR